MALRLAQTERPWLLVVDEENEILGLLVRSLRDGCRVLSARDGAEALKLLSDDDVAVVISEERLPLSKGLEVARETLRRRPGARRILVTGYAELPALTEAPGDAQTNRTLSAGPAGEVRAVGDRLELRRLQLENARLARELSEAREELRRREDLLTRGLDERGEALLAANLDLERQNTRLAGLARRDGLTNLYNHRTLMERLDEEIARARRCGTTLSLVFGDIDQFKLYNDRMGHPAGDACLVQIARVLEGDAADEDEVQTRSSDIVARYGGEEFVLLLPETDKGGARIKAERLRLAVSRQPLPGADAQPGGRLTMSFGVASFPGDAGTAADLVARADEALFAAKRAGRDQVAVTGVPSPSGSAPREVGSYRRLLPVLGGRLFNDGALAVLSVTLTQLPRVEEEYGSQMCRALLAQVEEGILQAVGVFEGTPILGTCEDETNLGLLVFLPGRRSARSPAGTDLEEMARRLEAALQQQLLRLQRLVPAPGRVVVGWGEGVYSSRMPTERLVAEVAKEAAESAARRLALQQGHDRSLLRRLLVEERLAFDFQPIVAARGERFGWEALARGPDDLPWNRPEQLFGRAAEAGLLDELDRGCALGAVRAVAGKLAGNDRLFVNVLPSSLYDQTFVTGELPAALAAARVPLDRVVLEVTEQHAIESLAVFQESLRCVVAQGMAIALDDVGTGNSNLKALLEIRPAFVKLDRHLIDGVATNEAKRGLVAALVAAAGAMPATLIAEGVERVEDAEELRRLDVGLLQGNLFGRPGPIR